MLNGNYEKLKQFSMRFVFPFGGRGEKPELTDLEQFYRVVHFLDKTKCI